MVNDDSHGGEGLCAGLLSIVYAIQVMIMPFLCVSYSVSLSIDLDMRLRSDGGSALPFDLLDDLSFFHSFILSSSHSLILSSSQSLSLSFSHSFILSLFHPFNLPFLHSSIICSGPRASPRRRKTLTTSRHHPAPIYPLHVMYLMGSSQTSFVTALLSRCPLDYRASLCASSMHVSLVYVPYVYIIFVLCCTTSGSFISHYLGHERPAYIYLAFVRLNVINFVRAPPTTSLSSRNCVMYLHLNPQCGM